MQSVLIWAPEEVKKKKTAKTKKTTRNQESIIISVYVVYKSSYLVQSLKTIPTYFIELTTGLLKNFLETYKSFMGSCLHLFITIA